MILEIQLNEIINGFETLIKIDLIKENLLCIKNNSIIKDGTLNISTDILLDLIKNYTTYWNQNYINNKFISGSEAMLKIKTDIELISFYFKNEYPPNYNEFLKIFKEILGVI